MILLELLIIGLLSITFSLNVEGKSLEKHKRDVKDMAETAILYGAGEFNNRMKAPIGAGQSYKLEGAGKEFEAGYGAGMRDQFAKRRRRRSPEGNDQNGGGEGGNEGGHGGLPGGGVHGGPPGGYGSPHGGGHGGPPGGDHGRSRRAPCGGGGGRRTTPPSNPIDEIDDNETDDET